VFEDPGIKNMTGSAKGTVEEPSKNVRQKAELHRSILNAVWGRIKTTGDTKDSERISLP
jgi:putative transposase